MGRCHEQACDEILFAGLHPRTAFAAAPLSPIGGKRNALNIAAVADGDDHILFLDKVFVVHVSGVIQNCGFARRGIARFHIGQLINNDGHHPLAGAQNIQIVGNLNRQFVQFFGDFLPA